jgi:hypothetical protein
MGRVIDVNLDTDEDVIRTLGRFRSDTDRLSLHKGNGFRITAVIRLHPPPFVVLDDPSKPEYPFVGDATGAANKGSDGRFRITTPDLKQDNGVKFARNNYMLDWVAKPQSDRPGPHFKVFP